MRAARCSCGVSVDRSMGEFRRRPIPSPAEQLHLGALIRRWLDWSPGGADAAPENVKRAGLRARNRLVEGNMRLVATVAGRFTGRGLDLEDLMQEGAFGLARAAELYDPTRGYRFATYSYWWIRQSMTHALMQHGSTIRVSGHCLKLVWRSKRFIAEFMASHSRGPTDHELAEGMALNAAAMERLQEAGQAIATLSLSQPTGRGSFEQDLTLADTVASDSAHGADALVLLEEHELLRASMEHLSPQQRLVVGLRHEDGCSFAEIATALGMGQREALAIHRGALLQLRRLVEGGGDGTPPPFQPTRDGATELVLIPPAPQRSRRSAVGGVQSRMRRLPVAAGQIALL